jgi:hypothetical protein
MSNRSRHFANLPIFTFNQFQTNPAIWHAFAETNWRDARRNFRLWFQNPRATRQRFAVLNQNSLFQLPQTFRRRNLFDLRPILARVRVARMQQTFVPRRFIAQKQQTFGIYIEPSNRINIFWKIKFRQRAIFRAVARELRKHAKRFVKSEEHCAGKFATESPRTQRKFFALCLGVLLV